MSFGDDFPGADHVPWPELIRARYQFELDGLVASIVTRAVSQVATRELTEQVARAAAEAVRFDGEHIEAPAERRIGMLSAVADWDGELCPIYWWPPRPHRDDELGDPLVNVVLDRALTLVQAAGSDQLQKILGGALEQGGFR